MPAATSDGDVLVFFRKSDVVVTGGVIEDLTYPVIRLADGGTVNGTLAALNRVLDLTVAEWRAQGGTMVIPNRGRIYDEGDVAEYRDMMTIVRDRVQDAIGKGRTLEQVQAARLARDYDGRYAAAAGPAAADEFIATVYRSLSAAAQDTRVMTHANEARRERMHRLCSNRMTAAAMAAVIAAGAWPACAAAHHSFAMYDQAQVKTLTGKLTRYIPGANHAQLIFELLEADGTPIVDAAGKPVLWGVETGPAARIAQQGVTPDNFPAGTIVTVTLNPLRNGKTFGAMPNGTPIVHCGTTMPQGGCTAETGRTYLGQND